jgi:hypothetical protein
LVCFNPKQPAASGPNKRLKEAMWYDSAHKVTDEMCQIQIDLHAKYQIKYAPPPPTNTTQIIKLKWLPSNVSRHNGADGIWHGLFALDIGASKQNRTLQECSLPNDWVEGQFSKAFRDDCKGVDRTKRNDQRYLYIPAGDTKDVEEDPPPISEFRQNVSVKYQQGKDNTCFRHSLASAVHAMGFIEEAKQLADEENISGNTIDMLTYASQFVRAVFKKTNLSLNKVFSTACSIEEVTQEDSSWPMILILQTSDGTYGSHAITMWNGMIFDSNCPMALRWSQKSLNWCSGEDCLCIGFSKAYRLCPTKLGQMLPDSPICIGTQVFSSLSTLKKLGWVQKLPTKKPNGEQKKGYIVCFIDSTHASWSYAEVCKYKI